VPIRQSFKSISTCEPPYLSVLALAKASELSDYQLAVYLKFQLKFTLGLTEIYQSVAHELPDNIKYCNVYYKFSTNSPIPKS